MPRLAAARDAETEQGNVGERGPDLVAPPVQAAVGAPRRDHVVSSRPLAQEAVISRADRIGTGAQDTGISRPQREQVDHPYRPAALAAGEPNTPSDSRVVRVGVGS